MDFFSFPYEIRLNIYSELFVQAEPIVFIASYDNFFPPLFRAKKDGLFPAFLRVNKTAHSEASPLLYSKNQFRFPDIFTSTDSAYIAPFLRQIGSQASLLRHICISFPTFEYFPLNIPWLHDVHINNLELIRDTCTSITTLELSLLPNYGKWAWRKSSITAETLDLLDEQFKTFSSLKDIIINFHVYRDEDRNNEQVKIRDRGWIIEVTKVPKEF